MPCRQDIKAAILDKAFSELTDRRNTFSRISNDTIQVNGIVDNTNTKAQSRVQARAIANELLNRVGRSFNGHVKGYVNEVSEFDPITVTFIPSDRYVDHEFNKLSSITRTEENSDEKLLNSIDKKIDRELIGLSIWNRVKDGREISSENYKGLCNSTAQRCIRELEKIGIKAYPYEIGISAKAPFNHNNLIAHYVAVVNINNKVYIYDMPQNEFIKEGSSSYKFIYTQNFNPRFIELTIDNLVNLYGNTRDNSEETIDKILNKTNYNSLSFQDYLKQTSGQGSEETRNQVNDNSGINTSSQLSAFEPNTHNTESGVYQKFITFKKTQLNEYQRRLNQIKSDRKKKDVTAEQLTKLNKLEQELNLIIEGKYELGIKGLKQEIDDLSDSDKAKTLAVGYYVQKDLDRLGKLVNSKNIDDINEAKRLVDFYDLAGTFTLGVENPFFTQEEIFLKDENGKETSEFALPESVRNQFEEWGVKARGYNSQIELRKREITVDTINTDPLVKNTYKGKQFEFGELVNDIRGLKDTDWISMWTMDITHGLNSTNGLIPQVIFSRLAIGTEQKEAWSRGLAEEVDNMKADVERELMKLPNGSLRGIGILGIKGASYNLFKQISKEGNETHNLVQRHTKEFEDNYEKAKNTFFGEFNGALAMQKYDDSQKAINTAFEKFKQWRRANTIIIDITKLSKIASEPEFLGINAVGDATYEKSLIDILGQKGFDEQVDEQMRLLRKYQVDRQGTIETAIIRDNVNTYDELSDKIKNNIKQWEFNHSPIKGYQDYNSVGQFFGDQKSNSFMDYNSFIPRKYTTNIKADVANNSYSFTDTATETGHFDKSFETIEANPTLSKFYDKLREFCEVVHENMPYDIQQTMGVYTLPGLLKTSAEIINDKNTGLLSSLVLSFRHLMDRIRSGFGIVKQGELSYAATDPITKKVNYQVNDGFLRGNKKALDDRMTIERTKFLHAFNGTLGKKQRIENIKKFSALKLDRFNPSALALLADYIHVDIRLDDIKAGNIKAIRDVTGDVVDIGRIIADFSLHSVVQSQSFDLPKLMKYFSDMTMAYAARQEALPILEIMKKHYDAITNPKTQNLGKQLYNVPDKEHMKVGLRTNAIKQMDNWFERVVLNNYGNKHAGEIGKIATGDKVPFFGRTIYTSEERKKFDELTELIKNEPVEKKQNELKTIREGLGKTRTDTALYDNILNWIRTLRLGYNLSSATTNFLEGVTSNMILGSSSEYFEPRELLYGYNTVKYSFLKNLSFGYAETPRAQKNRSLMDKFNVIIDSKNELQKASHGSLASKFSWLNPHEINQRVEFINQSPLMIAMLRTLKIKDKDGNEEKLWNAYTKEGHLKPEFKTEDNVRNWEELAGEDYLRFKQKLNKVIILGHGNYDATRGMLIKSNTVGKAGMMFKTWIPEALYWRFATEQDDIQTGATGFKGRYWSYTPGAAGVHGAVIGGVMFGPIGAAIGYGVGITAGYMKGTRSETGLIMNTILATKQLFLKALGMPVNLLVGRQIIGDNIGKNAFESWVGKGTFTEQDAKNLKGNMADISMQLAWLGLILLVKGMFWDDDDKPGDTDRQVHNVLINRLMNLSSQAAMYVNPHDLWGSTIGSMAVVQYLEDCGKEIIRVQKAIDGDDIIQTGVNAGKSGAWLQTKKIALPGMFKDTQLGFGSQMDKVYPEESPYHKYFHSQAYREKAQLKGDRASRRLELKQDEGFKAIKDDNERKKAIERQVDIEFPSQKKLDKLGETRDEYNKSIE